MLAMRLDGPKWSVSTIKTTNGEIQKISQTFGTTEYLGNKRQSYGMPCLSVGRIKVIEKGWKTDIITRHDIFY